MTRRRAGAPPQVLPGGVASVDVIDRLVRQLGRVVLVNSSNTVLAVSGGNILEVNLSRWFGSLSPTIGPKVAASSIPVVLPTDLAALVIGNEINGAVANATFLSVGGTQVTGLSRRLLVDAEGAVVVAGLRAALLHVTAVGAVNTAVTATIPAAGAGLFHYFTKIELIKGYSVVGVAAGAGVTITSTNLPGGPAWSTEQIASAAGTRTRVIDYEGTTPLRSAVGNTATTFVAPAQLQTIWRWNVSYFTAV